MDAPFVIFINPVRSHRDQTTKEDTSNYGKLVKKQTKARTGRNPATGAEIQIPAKTVIRFRVAKAAKDAVIGPK